MTMMMDPQLTKILVADKRDRLVAEAEAYRLSRSDLAKFRRPSFLLRLMRRLSQARRATPVTAASIASATAPKITAPTT